MHQINVNPIKTLLVAVAVCLTFGVIAQEKSTPLEQVMEGLTVRNIGPAGMSGRVTCIAAHPLKAYTQARRKISRSKARSRCGARRAS